MSHPSSGPIGLALLSWAAVTRGEQAPSWVGLRSADEIEVIETLRAIARAGPEAAGAAEDVAGLMKESARGRRLSRWCYHALSRIGERPEEFLGRYIDAAGWEPPPERPGMLLFSARPGDEEMNELPEYLRAASDDAWRTCFRAVIGPLRDEDRRRRRRARECLDSMIEEAPHEVFMPLLLKVLSDAGESAETRCLAVGLVERKCRTEDEVEAFVTGLREEEDVIVRRAFARALCTHFFLMDRTRPGLPGRSVATPGLFNALRDADPEVRSNAAKALAGAQHATGAFKAPLLQMLREGPESKVVHAVIWALCCTGTTEVVPFAVKIIEKHPNADMKRKAMHSLNALGGALKNRRDTERLTAVAGEVVPLLTRVFRENWKENRRLASISAYALRPFGELSKEAVPELHRALKEAKDDGLKTSLACTLGCIGPASSEAVPDILAVASPDDARRNHAIATALGRIGRGGRDVEGFLIRFAEAEPDWWNRISAVRALGAVAKESPAVMEALENYLEDPDPHNRQAAEEAIRAVEARSRGVEPRQPEDAF